MTDKRLGFAFSNISSPKNAAEMVYFSPQNKPNDGMFQKRQTPTVMTFYLWRNRLKIMILCF